MLWIFGGIAAVFILATGIRFAWGWYSDKYVGKSGD